MVGDVSSTLIVQHMVSFLHSHLSTLPTTPATSMKDDVLFGYYILY